MKLTPLDRIVFFIVIAALAWLAVRRPVTINFVSFDMKSKPSAAPIIQVPAEAVHPKEL